MKNELLDKIKEYENITLFRHISPDGDAIFSQHALFEFINDNFKDKKVKCCGFSECDLLPGLTKVSDRFIRSSLAIVLDTANIERCDDIRFLNADYIIKIDHHPNLEPYGDINIVDNTKSATCELLADILFSKEFKSFIISNSTAEYLLCGILTDTLNLSTSSTSYKTLNTAGKLVKLGNLNMSDYSNRLFSKHFADFNKISAIRNRFVIDDGVGYIIMNNKDLNKYNITVRELKDNVSEFKSIKEIEAWAVFGLNKKTGKYEGSLRSKNRVVVNTIANKYGGGGHPNAAGVKSLTLTQVKEIINELKLSSKC